MNEDEQKNPIITDSLHTLEGDLLASMKDDNYSSNIVKIVTQGKNQNPVAIEKQGGAGQGGITSMQKYITLAIVLLFGAVAMYFYVTNTPEDPSLVQTRDGGISTNTEDQPATNTVPIVQPKTIFEADIVIPLAIRNNNKAEFLQKITEAKQELVKNKVAAKTNISFILDTNLENLFNKIQYSGPESLLRSFSQDHAYNFGLYHAKDFHFETYLLVKVEQFDLAFSGMLEWERTISIDLENIYRIDVGQNVISTSTTSSVPKFTDRVIKNIDARTYTDTQKGITITYGFINRKYLFITSGENSFTDIVNNLLVKNVLR